MLVFNQSAVATNGGSTLLYQQWQLCSKDAPLVCGLGGCYNSADYVCYPQDEAALTTDILCPVATPKLCGTSCYSSTQYKCQNGQLQQV